MVKWNPVVTFGLSADVNFKNTMPGRIPNTLPYTSTYAIVGSEDSNNIVVLLAFLGLTHTGNW